MEQKINAYDAIQTGRYKGKYQITLGYLTKGGEFGKNFIKKRDANGDEKHYPAAFTFDTDAEAEGTLLSILNDLTGKDYGIVEKKDQKPPTMQPQSDCPF